MRVDLTSFRRLHQLVRLGRGSGGSSLVGGAAVSAAELLLEVVEDGGGVGRVLAQERVNRGGCLRVVAVASRPNGLLALEESLSICVCIFLCRHGGVFADTVLLLSLVLEHHLQLLERFKATVGGPLGELLLLPGSYCLVGDYGLCSMTLHAAACEVEFLDVHRILGQIDQVVPDLAVLQASSCAAFDQVALLRSLSVLGRTANDLILNEEALRSAILGPLDGVVLAGRRLVLVELVAVRLFGQVARLAEHIRLLVHLLVANLALRLLELLGLLLGSGGKRWLSSQSTSPGHD